MSELLSVPRRRGPLRGIVFVSVIAALGGALSVGVAAPASAAPENQWGLNAINIDRAWDITKGSRQITIAVIDSGIDTTHPAFPSDRIVNGWNFLTNSNVMTDTTGHGTKVSSVAMGFDRNDGFRGAAPEVRVMPLAVVRPEDEEEEIPPKHVADAIDYAIKRGADVINLSSGSSDRSWAEGFKSAISRANVAGIPIVVSAGNEGRNIDGSPFYPASYATELPNVISVAAIDENRALWGASNYGVRSITLAAPGVDIRVAESSTGAYGRTSGTSLAAPFVSGTIALMKTVNPVLTPSQIRDALTQTVTPQASLNGKTVSGGYLNTTLAVKTAQDLGFNGKSLGFRSVSDRTRIIDANNSSIGSRITTESASESSAQTIVPIHDNTNPGTYWLMFHNTSMYLTWSYGGNPRVTITDNPHQGDERLARWRFIPTADGSYRVSNVAGGTDGVVLYRDTNNDATVVSRESADANPMRASWWIDPIGGPLVNGATYQIASTLRPQSVIDAAGTNPTPGAAATVWNNYNQTNQKWVAFYDRNRGAIRLQNRAPQGRILNLAWISNTTTNFLEAWDGNWDDQFWVPQLSTDGNWVIRNFRDMNRVIDLTNGNVADNTRLTAQPSNGGNNQRWIFNRTNDPIINP